MLEQADLPDGLVPVISIEDEAELHLEAPAS
jgi:hypothetical protein